MHIDQLDRRLIAILRSNARTPIVTIAKQLKVSRATVQNRMDRLEREKVITNYTVALQSELEDARVAALMNMVTESKKEASVIRTLRGFPAVVKLHHTTGHWDLIVELRTDTLAEFNHVVSQIRLIDGVKTTESNLLLESHVLSQ